MKKISLKTVKKHNKAEDCWVVVDNNVYDVTNHLPTHSGGAEVIAKVCGADATKYFSDSQPGTHAHSDSAKEKLKGCLIGKLK